MTAAFRAAGVDARYVTGNTKESERKALVEAFKAGEFPVMVNCQLFTEGTDIPNVSFIPGLYCPELTFSVRLTASLSLVRLDREISSVKWYEYPLSIRPLTHALNRRSVEVFGIRQAKYIAGSSTWSTM